VRRLIEREVLELDASRDAQVVRVAAEASSGF